MTRAFPWVMAGMGIGAGLTIMFMNEYKEAEARFGARSAAGSGAGSSISSTEEEEWPLGKSFAWGTKGTKERGDTGKGGKLQSASGAVKEELGRLTGGDQMVGESVVDRAVGKARDAAGEVGHAVGQTIHDLNR